MIKMEKKGVKFLSILLLSLFIASIFLSSLSFVSAQDAASAGTSNPTPTPSFYTAVSKLSGNFQSVFTQWSTGTGVSANVAKVLFLVLIWLILVLILNGIFAGFNQMIVNVLALIIAFLATAYITPAEFFGVLQSYNALGLTLASLVPFAILAALSYRAATVPSGRGQLIMLQLLGWIFFAIYSLYRAVIYMWGVQSFDGITRDMTLVIILTALAILSAIAVFFNGWIMGFLIKQFNTAQAEAAYGAAEAAAYYEAGQARAAAILARGRGTPRGP